MKETDNDTYKSILLNCESLQNCFEEQIDKLILKLESKILI